MDNILKPSRFSGEVVDLFKKRQGHKQSLTLLECYIRDVLASLSNSDGAPTLSADYLCLLHQIFKEQIDILPPLTLKAISTVRQHIELFGRWHTGESERELWAITPLLPDFNPDRALKQLRERFLEKQKVYAFPSGNILQETPYAPFQLQLTETFFWVITRMFRFSAGRNT